MKMAIANMIGNAAAGAAVFWGSYVMSTILHPTLCGVVAGWIGCVLVQDTIREFKERV